MTRPYRLVRKTTTITELRAACTKTNWCEIHFRSADTAVCWTTELLHSETLCLRRNVLLQALTTPSTHQDQWQGPMQLIKMSLAMLQVPIEVHAQHFHIQFYHYVVVELYVEVLYTNSLAILSSIKQQVNPLPTNDGVCRHGLP